MKHLLTHFGSQPWSMHADYLRRLETRLGSLQAITASLSPREVRDIVANGGNPIVPEVEGSTATIEIMGDLLARAPWFLKAYGDAVDPYDVADAVDALAADPAITALVIEMDSCGGTTAGTFECAAALDRFRAAGKTIEVRAAGVLASAAYAIACRADRVIATPTTIVGSLGTMILLCDESAADAEAGLAYEVVSTAPAKGLGADGKTTQLLRDEAKAQVDAINAIFQSTVASGRRLSHEQTAAVFTGQVWLAGQAQALGLIDVVDSPADELDQPTGDLPAPEPTPPALPPVGGSVSTAAAAASQKASTMDLIKTLAALTASHPTHAAALVAAANQPGATEASLQAVIATAETADLKAQLAAAQARATAAESEAQAAKAEAAQLKAHAQGRDPGADDESAQVRIIPLAKSASLTVEDMNDLKAGKAKMGDK